MNTVVFVVLHGFPHGSRSFYPGETFTADQLTEAGMDEAARAHQLRRGMLEQVETGAVAPAAFDPEDAIAGLRADSLPAPDVPVPATAWPAPTAAAAED